MNPEYIFMAANIVFAIGTLLLFKKVIKNRNALNDFDFIGSTLTAFAMFLMFAGYYQINMFRSIVFLLPTLVFWVFVSVYSVNNNHMISD